MNESIDITTTLGWVMSTHAKQSADRRGVSTQAVLECIAAPEISYPSRGQRIVRRGQLAVVADTAARVVLTVLLTGSDAWTDEKAKAVFAHC